MGIQIPEMNKTYNEQLLRLNIGLVILFGLIPGPSFTTIDLRLFDILIIPLCIFLIVRLFNNSKVQFPSERLIFLGVGLFVTVNFTIAIVGFIRIGYPIGYIGELRWVHLIIVMIAIFATYSDSQFRFIQDLTYVSLTIFAIFLVVFIGQVFEIMNVIEFNHLLENWYRGEPQHSDLGDTTRFSGPVPVISGGARILTFVLIVVSVRVSMNYSNLMIGILLLTMLMLVATGHRTSYMIVFVFWMVLVWLYRHQIFNRLYGIKLLASVLTGFAILGVSFMLDLGGFQSRSHRIFELYYLAAGRKSWTEVTGRNTEVWISQVQYIQQKSPVGTYINPRYVDQEFFLDSYFMVAYLQGRELLLLTYILLLFILLMYSLKLLNHPEGKMTLGMTILLSITSLTQNLSGLFQMVVIILIFTICCLKYTSMFGSDFVERTPIENNTSRDQIYSSETTD